MDTVREYRLRRQTLRDLRAPPGAGTRAQMLGKDTRQMALVGEPRIDRDIAKRFFGGENEMFRPLEPLHQ